jgi:hypothetical protein
MPRIFLGHPPTGFNRPYQSSSNLEAIYPKVMLAKGSLGHVFTANTCTGSICQASYCPCALRKVSDLPVLTFVGSAAFPCGKRLCRLFRSLRPPCRNRAFRRSFRLAAIRPTVARHSLHLRFAEPIPKNLQGVFSDTAAGIASAVERFKFLLSF